MIFKLNFILKLDDCNCYAKKADYHPTDLLTISEMSCFEQELGAQIATLVCKSCPISPGGEAWNFQTLEKMIHIF